LRILKEIQGVTMSNKIYVIQEATAYRDYSSALKYGTLVFLLESKFRSSRDPQKALVELREKLKPFRPTDFILWSAGDYLSPILTGIVLAEKKIRYFNWLKWERTKDSSGQMSGEGYYVPVRVLLNPESLDKPTQ